MNQEAEMLLKLLLKGERHDFCIYLRPFDISNAIVFDKRRRGLTMPYHPDVIEPDEAFQLDEIIRLNLSIPLFRTVLYFKKLAAV